MDGCNGTPESSAQTCQIWILPVFDSHDAREQKEFFTILLWSLHCKPLPQKYEWINNLNPGRFEVRYSYVWTCQAWLRRVMQEFRPTPTHFSPFLSFLFTTYLLRGFKAGRLKETALCCADRTQRRHCLAAEQGTASARGGSGGERLRTWAAPPTCFWSWPV